MEVTPTPNQPVKQSQKPVLQMRDYWSRYRAIVVVSVCLMQLTIICIVAMALIIGGAKPASMLFWITVCATTLASVPLNLYLTMQLLVPLRDLTNTITNAAGEKPRLPLANPNTPRYESDGFGRFLQYIYDGSATKDAPSKDSADSPNELLAAALKNTRAGVIVMNAKDGRVVFANKSAPVRQDTNEQPELELMFNPEGLLSDWLAHCRNTAVHAEKTWYRVANRIVGDTERRIFNVSANYEKGSAAEVVLVTFDATDKYQPEDDDLDFIAFAAHELRGPITVIRGYLDVLDIELEGTLAPDQQQLIQRLIVSANRLTGYVNNILNASKYDRRHLRIHLSEETVTGVYDSIKDDMELRASSQNRLLAVTFPADLPSIAADRTSLGEVIANLIDNAIKYSNEGGSIAVNAITEGSFVRVSVTDHGIGMPSNVVGNLFQKFYRSHRSRETFAGSGIGLYISKAIVESHGGSIEVTSREGEGSTFSFTVPVYASVADKLQANDRTNAGLISSSEGWIKNHSRFKS
jgi:signal transduction histidine kinase